MKLLIHLFLLTSTLNLAAQGIHIKYSNYREDTTLNYNLYISDTCILKVYFDKDTDYSIVKLNLKKKEIEYISNSKYTLNKPYKTVESFKESEKLNKADVNKNIGINIAEENSNSNTNKSQKIKIKYTKEEKYILGYKCKNAIVEGNGNIYNLWYTNEIPETKNINVNVCTYFSSIKAPILEYYVNNKLVYQATEIIKNEWKVFE